ncbi:MAG: hypothetical protein JNJ54_34195 [Myxococcaceae bacterium]|nr:hypothetical protein [Myxococcaceae bacterium]
MVPLRLSVTGRPTGQSIIERECPSVREDESRDIAASMAKTKVMRLGLKRSPGTLYIVDGDEVVQVQKGRRKVVARLFEVDPAFVYSVDADGDVSRQPSMTSKAARSKKR